MTFSLTTRLGLPRWSADDDPQNRAQFDAAFAALEANAAMFKVVTAADHSDRGAAGKVGRLARCSVHGEVWWDDGAAWQPVIDLSLPRGLKGWVRHGSSSSDVTNVESLITDSLGVKSTVTFTVEQNRLYRVEWNAGSIDGQAGVPGGPAVSESAVLRLRYKAGSSNPTNTDALCGGKRAPVFSADSTWDQGQDVVGWINDMPAGTYTVGGFLFNDQHIAGSAIRMLTVATNMTLSIIDVGPAQ